MISLLNKEEASLEWFWNWGKKKEQQPAEPYCTMEEAQKIIDEALKISFKVFNKPKYRILKPYVSYIENNESFQKELTTEGQIFIFMLTETIGMAFEDYQEACNEIIKNINNSKTKMSAYISSDDIMHITIIDSMQKKKNKIDRIEI